MIIELSFKSTLLFLLVSFNLYFETNAQSCPALRSKKRILCYFASWAGSSFVRILDSLLSV